MEFLDSYMDVFKIVVSYVFSIGGGVIVTIALSAMLASALYGIWALGIKLLKIKNPPSYTKPFTIFALLSIITFLPLGVQTYISLRDQHRVRFQQIEYDKGWVFKETRTERFVLVHIDPPKHTYVSFKHEATGTLYERQYIGKHCNNWQTNKIGDAYNIQYNYYLHRDTGATRIAFINLSGVFC